VSLRTRTRPGHIRDYVDDDARVIALEAFRPGPIGHEVDRGQSFKLSDPIVRQYSMYFAVVIPVDQMLGEIER